MWKQVVAAVVVGVLVVGDAAATAAPAPASAEKAAVVGLLDQLTGLSQAPGGVAPAAYADVCRQVRGLLTKKDAQKALARDLPKLTTEQLLRLWDALWLQTERDPMGKAVGPKDMNEVANGFAARLNTAVLAALAKEKNSLRRRLLVNMIKPQVHTLTKEQAAEFEKAAAQPK